MPEAATRGVLYEIKSVFRNPTKFTGVPFLIKWQDAGVFCEFCEISKNTFFTDHLFGDCFFHVKLKLLMNKF